MLVAHDALPLLVVGCLLNIAPTYVALCGRYDAEARALMGTLAASIPAMLVFLLKGRAWQMDAHMYFFVGMAALAVLADWRPIAVATGLTAIHHFSLEWVAPAWVFAGAGNMGRVFFHVLAVGLECAALSILTIQLERLFASQHDALQRARQLTEVAEGERRKAERAAQQAGAAEADATRERQRRREQTELVAADRRGQLVTLVSKFEYSVSSTVRSIAQATESLEHAAAQLEAFTGATTCEADDVAAGAIAATLEITQVASSIRDLSQSIHTVGVAADRQATLTERASEEARCGVQTAAMLEDQAFSIESFLDTIRDIASKTNLLALNATIEAARAGEAGRGFGVVAAEVKSLSSETKRASDQISSLIGGIRKGVAETSAKLRNVSGAIGEVSAAASGIAETVDQQRSTARDVDDRANRVARSADAVESRMASVAKAAGTASSLSADVRGSASDLASSARDLRTSTDQFVSFLKAEPELTTNVAA